MISRRHVRLGAATAAAVALCALSTACERSDTGPQAGSNAGAAPSKAAKPGVGGCGRVFPPGARLPSWTNSAEPPTSLPWVMSADKNIVGVLFGQPLLAAPRNDGRSNKILWISRPPRDGQPLEVTGTRITDGKTVQTSQPADAGPGEIYPSIIDMPGDGCWRLDLAWGPNTATVFLYYGT